MKNIIELVPNISEGKNHQKISHIINFINYKTNAKLIHTDIGKDTNRTVLTIICSLADLENFVMRFIKKVFSLIDMRKHQGTHPRIGAIDVFPFIALDLSDEPTLKKLVKKMANNISKYFEIPVYLYAKSALSPEKISLSNIRSGEYELVFTKIQKLTPDYQVNNNKNKILKHGMLTMGVRNIMIAYNINLKTKDKNIAKKIAGLIRETGNKKTPSGFFKGLKSIGWYIEEYGFSQVSCNIMDYNKAPLHLVYEKVKKLAIEFGSKVNGSELIGLVPLNALKISGKYYANNKIKPDSEYIELAIKNLGLNKIKKFIPEERILDYLVAKIKTEN